MEGRRCAGPPPARRSSLARALRVIFRSGRFTVGVPSTAPRPVLRRLGWLSVLLTGAALFFSGLSGVSSVEGTLQAAQAEQRQALRVDDRGPQGWDCPGGRDGAEQVRSAPAEV